MKLRCIKDINLASYKTGILKYKKGEKYILDNDKLFNDEEFAFVYPKCEMMEEHFEEIQTEQTGDEFVIKNEKVKHPSHYNQGEFEVIDVINDWNLNFNLGNVIKYIARADYKGDRKENLQKALFYLKYELGDLDE